MNKKKVLIVGSSAKEYALAKCLSENKNIEEVFVAPGNTAIEEFAQCIDIREDAVSELLEFVIKNDITLTIASSTKAIKTDIVSDFRENSQLIFAPEADIANFAISRASAKKVLYKLHLPTPKFGVFEKSQLALDYLKNEQYPVLITTEFDWENDVRCVCSNVSLAKTCVNDIFSQDESRIVIESYIRGHHFNLYVITDGYQTLPLGVVGTYNFIEDGDAGLYTAGSGAYVPDYKVSFDVVNDLMDNVVSKILKMCQNKGKPYLGILGIECVLNSDNSYYITGFSPFLKDHDAQAVLNSVDTDIYSLFEACANDSFADDYEDIPIKDLSNISCVLFSKCSGNVITGFELVDDTTNIGHFSTSKNKYFEWLTNKGRTLVLTQTASTLTRARELLYDNIEEISFNGKKYRRDICAE